MSEIDEVKERITAIDQQMGVLQNERLLLGLRFALLLKQTAGPTPPPTPRGETQFYDAAFGGSGFEGRTT
jgi:hypothetical protein